MKVLGVNTTGCWTFEYLNILNIFWPINSKHESKGEYNRSLGARLWKLPQGWKALDSESMHTMLHFTTDMHRVWFTWTQCYILQRTGFDSQSHYVSIHCYIANCTVSDSRSDSRMFCYWYKTSRDGIGMVVSSVKRVKYRVVWALKVVRVLRWWWWCGSRPLQQPTGPWPPHLLGRALLLRQGRELQISALLLIHLHFISFPPNMNTVL